MNNNPPVPRIICGWWASWAVSDGESKGGGGGKAPRGGGRPSRAPREGPYTRAPRQEFIPRGNPFGGASEVIVRITSVHISVTTFLC